VGISRWDLGVVHEAFYLIMHVCACATYRCAVVCPLLLDLLGCHPPILVAWLPILALHHLLDDFVSVEMREMAVVPGGNGGILAGRVGADGILVTFLLKRDVCVSRVGVVG
jgi:hypothetical protein